MKATLRISILLNLALLSGLAVVLTDQRQKESAPAPVLSEAKPSAPVTTTPVVPAPSGTEPAPFRWSQLMSAKDYGVYIANLRAAGCPEPTLEDIVRGDTGRAFSWERNQLGLDGSSSGPWSRSAEMQLVANLLGGRSTEAGTLVQSTENPGQRNNNNSEVAQASVPPQNEGMAAPSYPLFLQNANWSALGFDANQQAAIAQVRQQFLGEVNNLTPNTGDPANQTPNSANPAPSSASPNSNSSAPLSQWQTALQNADDQLQALLGAQGYAAYKQQQYYAWYQPQVLANAGGGNLTINPEAFSSK